MLLKSLAKDSDNDGNGRSEGPLNLLAPPASQAMKAIHSMIVDLAATDIPIMVEGETGTGKEVVALAIHQLSRRNARPLTKVRCSSLDPGALSTLAAPGLEDSADSSRGTLLLDEVGDLSPLCQTKLLEAFSAQDDGSEKFVLGACVISTSCRNLERATQEGTFRRDLYYRLSGVCLHLPPLRERREDILPLANFFLDKHAKSLSRSRPMLDAETERKMSEYDWPGNVRELENVMRRAVALGPVSMALEGSLVASRAATGTGRSKESHSLKQAARAASRHAERELILKVLSETRWNRKRAAEELQISYKALLYKLKQIGLEEPIS